MIRDIFDNIMNFNDKTFFFKENYDQFFDNDDETVFINEANHDVASIYTSILINCKSLEAFQREVLLNLFKSFDFIRKEIDPYKLKDFQYCLTEDRELCLYRNTEKGITNLIIDEENLVSYSFISKTDASKDELQFFDFSTEICFEKLALMFFSH